MLRLVQLWLSNCADPAVSELLSVPFQVRQSGAHDCADSCHERCIARGVEFGPVSSFCTCMAPVLANPQASHVGPAYLAMRLQDIPSHKLLDLAYQMASRLGSSADKQAAFQKVLRRLLSRLAAHHPHHVLLYLFSLRAQQSADKVAAAGAIIQVRAPACCLHADLVPVCSPHGAVAATQNMLCGLELCKPVTCFRRSHATPRASRPS